MAKKHNLEKDIKSLNKNSDIVVEHNAVYTFRNSDKIGIASWGKIDFLKKMGYTHFIVDQLNKKVIREINKVNN